MLSVRCCLILLLFFCCHTFISEFNFDCLLHFTLLLLMCPAGNFAVATLKELKWICSAKSVFLRLSLLSNIYICMCLQISKNRLNYFAVACNTITYSYVYIRIYVISCEDWVLQQQQSDARKYVVTFWYVACHMRTFFLRLQWRMTTSRT